MSKLSNWSGRHKQRGAVLLLSMIFLLLLAMVAGTTMHTTTLEVRMAGNNQFREEAFQQAQAVATAIAADEDNFPVTGGVGYTLCGTGDTDTVCDATTVDVDAAILDAPSGVDVRYRVERQGPAVIEGVPFRQAQNQASSSLAFDAAVFETAVAVDGSSVRLGSAEVAQGVARLVASGTQGQ